MVKNIIIAVLGIVVLALAINSVNCSRANDKLRKGNIQLVNEKSKLEEENSLMKDSLGAHNIKMTRIMTLDEYSSLKYAE